VCIIYYKFIKKIEGIIIFISITLKYMRVRFSLLIYIQLLFIKHLFYLIKKKKHLIHTSISKSKFQNLWRNHDPLHLHPHLAGTFDYPISFNSRVLITDD